MNKRTIKLITISFLIILLSQCSTKHFDIVIKNGIIYDGTGNPPIESDIGISDGIITKINTNLSTKGATVIEANNIIIAPGFIDMHTHCDGQILKEGMNSMENYLKQGVTTVVTGNCGSGTYEVEKFYNKLDSIGIGANIIHLIGHNNIRLKVMGMDDREPTENELEEMKRLVSEGMEGGAAGISSGLFYTPGAYSSTNEIIEIVKIAKEYNGFYATHLRDESNYSVGLEEAVKEALTVGEETGILVEISHIKALGKSVWGLSEKICRLIEDAQNSGIEVFADQYPYNASSTGLGAATIPAWVRAGGKMREYLNDPKFKDQINEEVEENIDRRGGPETLVIISYPNDRRFDGKNILEISQIINKTPTETAISLVLDGNPSIISYNMQESDINYFMQKDYVMTCSDGNIEVPGENFTHPRSYGTFPRKIRKYVFEDKTISLEHAIRAATSLPAKVCRLKNRGSIKEGQVADIVVFDPEKINDNATFTNPHQYSTGVEYLIVNGCIVIEKGRYNGKLKGKPIRNEIVN